MSETRIQLAELTQNRGRARGRQTYLTTRLRTEQLAKQKNEIPANSVLNNEYDQSGGHVVAEPPCS